MDDFRDLSEVEFEIARRGYDREQVDAHLAELRAELTRLKKLAEAGAELDDGSYPEPVQAELDRVSAEVETVIASAREAAEGLRTRAAAEASRWREEADADARRWRSEAEEESTTLRDQAAADAERTRAEAQSAADKERADAAAFASRTREEADAYAQQTRQAAESEATQLSEEADAYAAKTRADADEAAAEVREQADAHAHRVRTSADGYAAETRAAADTDAAAVRQEADAYAEEVRRTALEESERRTAEAATAAEEARTAAQEYASALRESADTETARQRADARDAAETARASVWEQSTAILENVAREVGEVRQQAETEALAIIADGERQSHRMVTQARQASEEQRRAARIEAERLVGDAQAQHDEIIETANRAAAAAQERAQALERRRAELMGQLEKTQEAMRTLEEELETRRGSLRDRDLPADTSTVKIVTPPEPEELAGVRVIPSAGRTPAPPVSAEEIMDDVRSLREQRSHDYDGEPVLEEPEAQASGSELDSLFATLREVKDTDEEPKATPRPRRPEPAVDPDELRERLLLPLQNRAHRTIKRQLTEQQNVALEQLRVAGADWQPAGEDHGAAFADAIEELVVESARAGFLAARELGVRSDEPPALEAGDVDIPTGAFVADLVAAVTEALEASRAAGETSRKTSGAVSKVYRAWRTDRAELRLREMSDVAYADALRVALREEGIEDTEWALGEWAAARHAS